VSRPGAYRRLTRLSRRGLLLRAALLAPECGVPDWREWRRRARLDDLDAEESRLVPLLQSLPGEVLAGDADRERIKGAARHAWARNQTLLRAFEAAHDALAGAGLAPLLIKGLSLALSVYPDSAARPAANVDLFVPREQVPAAVQALRSAGWAATLHPSAELLAARHALTLHDTAGRIVRLHWHALMERLEPKLDAVLFRVVQRTVRAGRVEARIPGVTGQFFHICACAAISTRAQRLQWAADAWHVLRSGGGSVDFALVEQLAVDYRLVVPVREALLFLSEILDAPIPQPTIERLCNVVVDPAEERARRRLCRLEPALTPLPLLWYSWQSQRKRHAPGDPAVGFIRYLCLAFDLEHPAALLPFLAGAGRRRLARLVGV